MRLIEALTLANQAELREGEPYLLFLACGFTPLHLETFLAAHLARALPDRRIQIQHGIYGDLPRNLELARERSVPSIMAAIEWPDLDPRLGIRSLGGWRMGQMDDIVETSEMSLRRLREALASLSAASFAVISLPTLPLPPVFQMGSTTLSLAESRVLQALAQFAEWAAGQPNVRVIHRDALANASPLRERWDPEAELKNGFPYKTAHADALASLAAPILAPCVRCKGIITDLDDTLWAGLAGEIGPANVTWSLENGAQIHGLYQQLLSALAETGTLVAIASKNDARVVAEALERSDLVIAGKTFFPVDVHWGPKSESVARILRSWNVGASSVVFIDDSPLELAEVRAAFPEMECIEFPKDSPGAALELLRRLRDQFGRESVNEEDRIRRESLERGQVFHSEAIRTDPEDFLRSLDATITISDVGRADVRAFELVNKTNQFKTNGARYSRDAWHNRASRPGDFVFAVNYEDRFGRLGKIAVMAGSAADGRIELEDWVISCRAFSRRIEFQCLQWLFKHFRADELEIHYQPTPRNGPAQETLQRLTGPLPTDGAPLRLTRRAFERECPMLYHKICEPRRSDDGEAQTVLHGGVSESE